jgi:divalent metal cation (Fe/Co/Zn/Cd) transporter
LIPTEKLNSASRVFLYSGIVLLPLSILEIIYGNLFSSYILLADAYHGFIDSSTAFLFSVLLKVIYRRTKRFPLGLYNLESLAMLMVSALILLLSVSVLLQSFSREASTPSWLSSLAWAGGLVTLGIYLLERRYNWLQLVRADMLHSKLDVVLEVLSGVGIIVGNYFLTIAIVTTIVGFILVDTAREVKEAILSLVGANCNSPLAERIETILSSYGFNVARVYVRRLGSFYMIHVIVRMPSETPLSKVYKEKKKAERIVQTFDGVAVIDVRAVPTKVDRLKKEVRGVGVPRANTINEKSGPGHTSVE